MLKLKTIKMKHNFSIKSLYEDAVDSISSEVNKIETGAGKAVKDAAASIKSETNKAIKNVGSTIKNIGSKVVGVAEDAPFVLLIPFKQVMKNALDKRGIAYSDHLYDIAPKFFNHIIKGNSFDDGESGFYNGSGATLYHADEVAKGAAVGAAIGTVVPGVGNAIGAGAGALVAAILKYIRELKEKKKAHDADPSGNPPLNADESAILSQSEQTAAAIVDSDTFGMGTGDQIKSFLFSWKGGLLLLGVIIGGYFLFKK